MKRESPAKKHHFWILLALVPLFTLIAVIVVDAKVGGEIDRRQTEIKAAADDISKKKDPKPEKLLVALDKVAVQVEKKQTDLHKENWERQKNLYTWPGSSRSGTSPVFAAIEQRGLKFGEPLGDLTAIFNEFQKSETYLYEYSSLRLGAVGPGTGMADLITPTQFRGNNWRNVLRHVSDFGEVVVSKDQVWLILEDMWVQRSLLDGIRSVNEEMVRFHRVKYEKDGAVIDDPAKGAVQNKTKRLFRNRIWELELEVVTEGSSRRLAGTLTNISDRLQLLGNGNVMTLHVWLSPNATQPVVFKIGNEFLPGKGATKDIRDKDGKAQTLKANVLPIVPMPDHTLAGSSIPADLEIARVEQVFDVRTVPVKRIDALVLGELDARSKGQPLLAPLSTTEGGLFTEAYVKDPVVATGADGMGGMGMPPGAGPGPPMPPGSGPPRGSGPPGVSGPGGASSTTGTAGGTLTTVVDANKKRYLARTPQVRRMPVGMVVIVDQAYMQDVLLALSNSPLRFQITQVAWTRYRGPLDGAGIGGDGAGGTSGSIDSGPRGSVGFSGMGDPDSLGGRPVLRGPVGPGPGPMPGPGPGPMPGSGSGGYPYPGSGGPSVVSDSQITSGLVELSVYGIVSLYEKYEAAKPADAPGAPTTPPGPENVPPGAPNTTPGSKMRRRVRA